MSWLTPPKKRKEKENSTEQVIKWRRHITTSTYIDDHLIYLTYINLLHRAMASYFSKNTTISTTNNKNLWN